MLSKILNAIIGETAEGQRKMAMALYVCTMLFIVAAGCVVLIWLVGGDAAAAKAPLLAEVAEASLGTIGVVLAWTAAANAIGDHLAGALGGKKSS